jgi:hypothetical protein
MLLNNYTDPSKRLGVGPLNDGITCGANHRIMGFEVFFLHNPTTKTFMECFEAFLSNVTKQLTVYYSGHGSQIKDTNGDEADGMDEVMVFDVVDDDLAISIQKCCKGKCRVLLIADCCRSGTLWDIPEDIKVAERTFPANVMSLAAAGDNQTSKQSTGLGGGLGSQGMFRLLKENPNLTGDDTRAAHKADQPGVEEV